MINVSIAVAIPVAQPVSAPGQVLRVTALIAGAPAVIESAEIVVPWSVNGNWRASSVGNVAVWDTVLGGNTTGGGVWLGGIPDGLYWFAINNDTELVGFGGFLSVCGEVVTPGEVTMV